MALTPKQPESSPHSKRVLLGLRESYSPQRSNWPPANPLASQRRPSPTFHSRIFEGSNYDESKQPEFRNQPSSNRRLQRDSSDQFLRSLKPPIASSKSATDLLGSAAGQFSRKPSRKRMFDEVIRESSPKLLPPGDQFTKAAGIHIHPETGQLMLNAAKVDHVTPLIHSDRNAKPTTAMDTAYNRQYSRNGFEPCHTPEKKPEQPTKIEATHGPLKSPKRYPFEVKSRLR